MVPAEVDGFRRGHRSRADDAFALDHGENLVEERSRSLVPPDPGDFARPEPGDGADRIDRRN